MVESRHLGVVTGIIEGVGPGPAIFPQVKAMLRRSLSVFILCSFIFIGSPFAQGVAGPSSSDARRAGDGRVRLIVELDGESVVERSVRDTPRSNQRGSRLNLASLEAERYESEVVREQ